jgi:hypothetical protein
MQSFSVLKQVVQTVSSELETVVAKTQEKVQTNQFQNGTRTRMRCSFTFFSDTVSPVQRFVWKDGNELGIGEEGSSPAPHSLLERMRKTSLSSHLTYGRKFKTRFIQRETGTLTTKPLGLIVNRRRIIRYILPRVPLFSLNEWKYLDHHHPHIDWVPYSPFRN